MFQTKVVEKIKTYIVCPITVFRKWCHLWDNVEKYCGAGQATDDNTAHAHWMLEDIRTRIMQYLPLFHWNNDCTNAP